MLQAAGKKNLAFMTFLTFSCTLRICKEVHKLTLDFTDTSRLYPNDVIPTNVFIVFEDSNVQFSLAFTSTR